MDFYFFTSDPMANKGPNIPGNHKYLQVIINLAISHDNDLSSLVTNLSPIFSAFPRYLISMKDKFPLKL